MQQQQQKENHRPVSLINIDKTILNKNTGKLKSRTQEKKSSFYGYKDGSTHIN